MRLKGTGTGRYIYQLINSVRLMLISLKDCSRNHFLKKIQPLDLWDSLAQCMGFFGFFLGNILLILALLACSVMDVSFTC